MKCLQSLPCDNHERNHISPYLEHTLRLTTRSMIQQVPPSDATNWRAIELPRLSPDASSGFRVDTLAKMTFKQVQAFTRKQLQKWSIQQVQAVAEHLSNDQLSFLLVHFEREDIRELKAALTYSQVGDLSSGLLHLPTALDIHEAVSKAAIHRLRFMMSAMWDSSPAYSAEAFSTLSLLKQILLLDTLTNEELADAITKTSLKQSRQIFHCMANDLRWNPTLKLIQPLLNEDYGKLAKRQLADAAHVSLVE